MLPIRHNQIVLISSVKGICICSTYFPSLFHAPLFLWSRSATTLILTSLIYTMSQLTLSTIISSTLYLYSLNVSEAGGAC